jgi:hypothetical protein
MEDEHTVTYVAEIIIKREGEEMRLGPPGGSSGAFSAVSSRATPHRNHLRAGSGERPCVNRPW